MSAHAKESSLDEPLPTWRVAPSLPVAAGVFLAYVAVFIGLSSTSGIAYAEWFDSGANAFRTAVIPLLGGSTVLVVFLIWARWDGVFKDPAGLPGHRFLWVPVVVFSAGILVHLAVADWAATSAGLLLAILAAGIMVGFAEETLFRGIILRSLRAKLRPEASVMLISSLWFGFFHLTNLANGSPVGGVLVQCLMASAMGVNLYAFRRVRGLLLPAMVAHGLWDMSVFLPTQSGLLSLLNLLVQVLVVVVALITAVRLVRRESTVTVDGPRAR